MRSWAVGWHPDPPVYIFLHIGKRLERAYLRALGFPNLRELSDWSGRAYSTLMSYRQGARRVTTDAARELVDFLRDRARTFTQTAEKLEAAINKEEGDSET